jgi:23S rRNA pseudouridine2604 synthase
MEDNSTSLNKYISQTGICSRREADKWIEAKRVKINGAIAVKGNRVLPNDKVTVDGKPIKSKPKHVYIALNKPPGITCTTDLKDKTNITDFVNHKMRIFPIGRLDKPSSGLILLTNDGDIVNKILRVENHHEKEYVVTVNKPITTELIKKMSQGVSILGTRTKKCYVEKMNQRTFRIVLTQGLNRQIRRMCDAFNYKVVTLKRIRIMNIYLDDLKVGDWRDLTEVEMSVLNRNLKDAVK